VTSRHCVPYRTSVPVEETVQFCEVESPEVMQSEMVTGVPLALEVAVRHFPASTKGWMNWLDAAKTKGRNETQKRCMGQANWRNYWGESYIAQPYECHECRTYATEKQDSFPNNGQVGLRNRQLERGKGRYLY
jgi:hypothetical protein